MKNPIYNISAKSNFFKELALGIIYKDLLTRKLKNNIVILPTKIACSTLRETFKELNISPPIIQAIGDLSFITKTGIENNSYLNKIALINKISKLILTMNIPGFTSIFAATELAEYFASLLNKLYLYQVNIKDIQQIITEDLDLHKQKISSILNAFMLLWEKNPSLTKTKYSNLLIEEFTENIGNKNVIIAGVNSTIPTIKKLLNKVYNLANSHIILYGMDENLTKEDWNNIEQNHPQYNFKSLFTSLNIEHSNVINWHNSYPYPLYISHAFRPAKLCDNWNKLKELECSNIKYLTLPDQHNEAKAILDLVKSYSDKKIMIITNDEPLTVKLIQHLNSANIDINIVRDYPLSNTKAAIWLKLCLNFILEKYSILSSLALLKHPFSSIDPLEIEPLLRCKDFFGYNIFDTKAEILADLLAETEIINRYINFKDFLTQHIKFAENIANQNIWEDTEEEEELKLYLDQLLESSENNSPISAQEYVLLFNHFLSSAYYRKETLSKNITLIKSIDARLHNADIVILAGLNQDVWPAKATIDPCFNQFSLEKIGLPSLKQEKGEETYDFCCFMQAEKVFLTRAEKIDGNITLESPWLSRLCLLSRNSIIKKIDLKSNNVQVQKTAKKLPSPPAQYRPKQLSVTQIEKLIFNPYHIYVDLILKLKKLPPLNKNISALDFGNFIHKALNLYHQNRQDTLVNAGIKALNQLGLNQPSIKMLWWPRFMRIAKWFILNENTKAKIFLENFGSMKIGDNFTIIAIADRLEFLSDSSVNIIDYKTGRLSSSKSITSGKTLQLLLESLIALENGFYCQKTKCNKINSLSYIQLSGGEDPATILDINIDGSEIITKTRKYIIELIDQYQDSSIPYHYTKKKTLGYCEYEHLADNM